MSGRADLVYLLQVFQDVDAHTKAIVKSIIEQECDLAMKSLVTCDIDQFLVTRGKVLAFQHLLKRLFPSAIGG